MRAVPSREYLNGLVNDNVTLKRSRRSPILLHFRSHPAFITGSVTLAIFTDIFLYGLFVAVFPFALRERIGIDDEDVQQWNSILLGLYGAGLLIGSPLFGWLADIFKNRRWPLLGGLVLLIASTVMLWKGRNIVVFSLGRAFQGFSAAIVWSVGLGLLCDFGREHISEKMGFVSIGLSAGMVTGPLLGGIIYEHAGYDTVFITAVGIIGLDIVLRILMIEPHEVEQYTDQSVEHESEDDVTRPLLSNGHSANDIDYYHSRRSESAFRVLLKSPRIVCTLVCALIEGICFTSFEATLPLYSQFLFGFGPTQASLMFAALMVPSLDSPVIGRIASRFGNRNVSLIGFILTGIFIILLRIPERDTTKDFVGFVVILVCLGISVTMILTPIMTEMFMAVENIENIRPGAFGPNGAFAQAYGLFNLAYAGGMLLGPLLAGHLREIYGWEWMTLVLGLMSFVICVPLWFLIGNDISNGSTGEAD